jgi:uncharacterized protein YjdB
MADKFDVYNDTKKIAHTESEGTDGQTVIGLSGLAASTTYDKIAVSYVGKSDKTAVPVFKTKDAAVIKVTGVTMSQKTAAMKVGDTKQVTGTVTPENATDKAVTYASGDKAIATVASDGTITAVAVGTVDVTVTTHDGANTDKVAVTVSAAE